MNSYLERVFGNRWFAAVSTLAVAYVSVRVAVYVVTGAYYDYYIYPHEKGSSYNYPQVRYALGQGAILFWLMFGLVTSLLLGRTALWRTDAKWAARAFIALIVGIGVLLMGLIAGMAMRDLGWLP